jgi:hypothetical protein
MTWLPSYTVLSDGSQNKRPCWQVPHRDLAQARADQWRTRLDGATIRPRSALIANESLECSTDFAYCTVQQICLLQDCQPLEQVPFKLKEGGGDLLVLKCCCFVASTLM